MEQRQRFVGKGDGDLWIVKEEGGGMLCAGVALRRTAPFVMKFRLRQIRGGQ